MSHVLLLRGVNVGGNRTFRPAVLAEQLRHCDVTNIGAAGTFVLRKALSREQIIETFRQRLPFETDIVVVEGAEMIRVIKDHPFHGPEIPQAVTRFVSFFSRPPESIPAMPFGLPDDESWMLRVLAGDARCIYGLYHRNMKAISYLGRLDRLFGVPLTTRSWNTISAIAKVLNATAPHAPEKSRKSAGNQHKT